MANTTLLEWYQYPICVPFGNANYDTQLGGSHDLDVQTPLNTPITALLAGNIVDLSSPSWGKMVGIALRKPIHDIPYMAYLHLAAINPDLQIGSYVDVGDLIGWSGGATSASQYKGTSNPTGQNFVNDLTMSSQPQTGIALMYGPVYGSGTGWEQFPPIDMKIDPSFLIWIARAAFQTWQKYISNLSYTTGIAKAWREKYFYGELMPPPTSGEGASNDWSGKPIVVQEFGPLRAEWNGEEAHWYHY